MLSKPAFEQQLDALCQSDKFGVWQERLTDCFYDKEAKDTLIREVRESVATQAADLSREEIEAFQRAVIARLVGLASQAAKRPQEREEPPLTDRSPQEIEDLVIDEFPYPIAVCYRRLTEAESPAGEFGCLLDTFESLLHYLAIVVLSAYWRDSAPEPDHNRRLLEKFYKGKWSTGDLMELLRETTKLYLSRPDALPYPQLVRHLFTSGGEPSPSLKVLEGFVELRNRAWAHTGGRDDLFYDSILKEHRQRLDEELNRCDWLTAHALWLAKAIDDDGRVTSADLLNGDRRRKARRVSLQLDPSDLDINGGDVVPERTLLLVDEGTGNYLPLFPLALFHFQQTSQGVFFLNDLNWAAKSELLRKARYLAYDPLLNKYESRFGEPAVKHLEAKVRQMEEPVQQSNEEDRSNTPGDWSKGREGANPLDAWLTWSIETASRDDISMIVDLDHSAFESDDLVDEEVFLDWWQRNPNTFTCIRWANERVAGYYALLFMKPDVLERFKSGAIRERELRGVDLCSPEEIPYQTSVYVYSVVVRTPCSAITPLLLNHLVSQLRNLYTKGKLRKVYAVAATERGLRLLEQRFRFTRIVDVDERPDMHPLFERILCDKVWEEWAI